MEQDKKKNSQNIIYQFDIYKHYILEYRDYFKMHIEDSPR